MASICQIGIVHFEDGRPVDKWSSLVNPNDYFDAVNVSIHGINEQTVFDAPDFKLVSEEINRRLAGQVVAIHTAFDRNAILRASQRNEVLPPDCEWINTASVARRAWPDVAQKGYGLSALAERFGFELKHHDALDDARAAGLILVRALQDSGIDLGGWMERIRRPINLSQSNSVAKEGNPEGPLFGEVLVFTGALTIPRREAAELAAQAGCETSDGVTKNTTLLVVGDQDIRLLNGQEKSSKHRKAEELITKGRPIRILTESDFIAMVKA